MTSQKSTTIQASAREPKRERGRLRVAAILDAAASLFAEKGYDAATMTEIAARASTAIGSLYQFFPTKEVLGDALLARYGEQIAAGLGEIALRAASLSSAALADALIDFIFQLQLNRATVLALAEASGDEAGTRAALRGALRREVAAILTTSSPTLDPARAETMAILLLQLLKPVPRFEREEPDKAARLVAETRTLIRLYLVDAL